MSKLPAPAAGVGSVVIEPDGTQLSVAHDSVGAFRTFCTQSHMLADDPIVKPNQPGGSHLHTFFGNTGTNAASTAASIASTGNSTCHGGTANRSSYWVPSIIDTRNGAPVSAEYMLVYYKSGYSGVSREQINAMPAGLRIVAGSSTASPSAPQTQQPGHLTPVASWTCGQNGARTLNMPTNCPQGTEMLAELRLPQCWDGVNLDSANHLSHMAYGTWGPNAGQNGAGCPSSHPVAIPEITMFVHYLVPADGTASWRLSSDGYTGDAAGYSLHGDWFNGWEPAVLDQWINTCTRNLDCQVDFLGNGTRLR